jgi:hypothetical protein
MDLGVVFPTTQIGTDPAVIRDFAQTAPAMTSWARVRRLGSPDPLRPAGPSANQSTPRQTRRDSRTWPIASAGRSARIEVN